jgi:rhodanese-related sulfurtransferase
VRLLRERGFDAVRLEDGVPDWRQRGYEIETNP